MSKKSTKVDVTDNNIKDLHVKIPKAVNIPKAEKNNQSPTSVSGNYTVSDDGSDIGELTSVNSVSTDNKTLKNPPQPDNYSTLSKKTPTNNIGLYDDSSNYDNNSITPLSTIKKSLPIPINNSTNGNHINNNKEHLLNLPNVVSNYSEDNYLNDIQNGGFRTSNISTATVIRNIPENKQNLTDNNIPRFDSAKSSTYIPTVPNSPAINKPLINNLSTYTYATNVTKITHSNVSNNNVHTPLISQNEDDLSFPHDDDGTIQYIKYKHSSDEDDHTLSTDDDNQMDNKSKKEKEIVSNKNIQKPQLQELIITMIDNNKNDKGYTVKIEYFNNTNVIIKNGVINCHTQTQQPQNKDNNLLNDILGNNIDDGNGSKAVQTIGDDMGDDINNDLENATKGGDCCILM